MDIEEKIIFFDGVCTLCNRAVNILIYFDKKKVLRYAPLQGKFVQENVVKKLKIEVNLDSIVFYENGILYYKSTAIIKILKSLGGVWILVNIFYILPRIMRDFIYDGIAKHRYKIFGKMDACRIPRKGEEVLFID